MSRNASASAEMNLCQDSQPRAVNPPAAAPEPHAGEWPAGLDWHAIARRIFRAAVVAALGLFLVAAAFAQVNPYPDARALAPAHTADQPYGPPTTGSASSILLVPGTLNLVSGLNGQGYGGDGGLANASAVQFDFPSGVAYDSSGNLYIADGQNYIVRKIDHTTGDISTFAGTPQTEGFSLNGGTAIGAQLGTLYGLIIDSSDNLYVADVYNDVIWKITSAGAISVFAGGGTSPGSCTGSTNSIGDGCLATDATLSYPIGLAFDAAGNLYIADSHNFLVREVAAATGKISTFAGNVGDSYDSGCPTDLYTTSTGPWTPTQAHLCFPYGVGFDSNGNFYVVESQRYLVRVVTKSTGDISTFAGGGSGTCTGAVDTFGDGCPASDAILSYPQGLYVDPDNRVYFADQLGDEIRMVDTSGNISIVLGGNGELVKASIGKPDTEEVFVSGSPVGSANGIDFFTMDPYGDIVATDADSAAVTSAGSSGGYVFPSTPIFTTATTTSAHAFSALFPPYILIINPSGVALSLGADPVITGPFGIVTGAGAGTCTFPGTVAPGESCTLVLSFTPTVGNNTTATGSIAISTNTGNSPNIIDLSGIGTGFATTSATVTPSLLTFTSTVNTASATQNATLTNTGQTAIAISSVGFTGEDPTNFAVSSTTCPAAGGAGALGIGDACTYSIDFTPNSATTFSAGFQVCISTASYGCINSTTVNGTGTAAAPATATPVITPAAGTYNAPVEVEITDSDSSATIYYTTNGDVPTTTNSTVYSGPFQLPVPGAQVQTFATSTGNPNSAVASSTFTVQPFLDFSNAAVGVAPGSAQQLTARFSLLGNTAPTAAAHYGHDYTLGAVSCTPSGSIEVCTVPITFIPTLPGGRRDALFLTNGSTRAATSLLYGIGQAPMSEVQPGIVTSPITSFSGYIYNSVVDENGTVYFLATETSDVYSLTKGGTPTLLPITGLNSPRSIAIDGAGVLYISDQKYNASMTTWDTVQSIQGTVTLPIDSYWQFSNVDGIGDLFVNSSDNNSIYELKTDGTTTDTVIDPAITGANNSTVDAAGD
ncbi:MAG TPA: chitobiase/beta-hexosaminidase C-terminal domain-containing protein, partial [Acidobacteriaceae bacterium]|nr:chitobiase/beta-hexosaminidase C-terminal domain-containing protein [Acidobacteriaceae bacterium]